MAIIAFDIRKAFDRLDHQCLLQTLSSGHLPQQFIEWLKSFLQERQQRVRFQGTCSRSSVDVTSGVPQGSVLAPYLFAAHMGSFKPLRSETRMLKYADDVTLLIPYRSNSELQSYVSDEQENMLNWCSSHGLTLNKEKTKLLLHGKSRPDQQTLTALPTIDDQVNILGIIFQRNLKWDAHIDRVTKSASRRVHVLRQLKKISTVTKKDLLIVYESFILSLMEYNCPVFVGLNDCNNKKIEKIRKRCHRIICGLDCSCDLLTPVKGRRQRKAMKIFTKMLNSDHLLHHLTPHRLPRSGKMFIEPIKTDRRAQSFIPYCSLQWNAQLNT